MRYYTIKDIADIVSIAKVEDWGKWVVIWTESGIRIKIRNF